MHPDAAGDLPYRSGLARYRGAKYGGCCPNAGDERRRREDAITPCTAGAAYAARPSLSRGRTMNCREFLDFLNEYLGGDLSPVERTEFDKHLAECPWCVAYLDNYRKTILLARSSVSTSEAAK